MFTGIIRGVGRVAAVTGGDGDARIEIDDRDASLGPLAPGDSVAVDGVCLTAVTVNDRGFAADVSAETLRATTLGRLTSGAAVNLEPALRAGDPLGGHLVSGHVDGVGELLACGEEARSRRLRFAAPPALGRYIAVKGSITVDGVSLTVNAVDGAEFEVNVIPHTLIATNLGGRAAGDAVNLEVDPVARYLERLLAARGGNTE
jgi:riboflavin synthase